MPGWQTAASSWTHVIGGRHHDAARSPATSEFGHGQAAFNRGAERLQRLPVALIGAQLCQAVDVEMVKRSSRKVEASSSSASRSGASSRLAPPPDHRG
jgi:hypothetical protein